MPAASQRPQPATLAPRSTSSEAERRPLSQYMQVDESTDDGGWTIFDSADVAPSQVSRTRLDLSVLKEIKNFLTSDAPSDDEAAFLDDETFVDANEVRVAYPFYDGGSSDFNAFEPNNAAFIALEETGTDETILAPESPARQTSETAEIAEIAEIAEVAEVAEVAEIAEVDENSEDTQVGQESETGGMTLVDFTETLAAVQPRSALNVVPVVPPRTKRRTLRVKAAFQVDAAPSARADLETPADALDAPSPADETNAPKESDVSPIADAAPQKTPSIPQINVETPFETVDGDALTAFATTVEPDRSFYFSESTESARPAYSSQNPQTAPLQPSSTFADVPVSSSQRSSARRLTILQRFVKLVAKNQESAVAPSSESRRPSPFAENVAFVVSPSASPEPTAQPVDASFPFVVDAFEPAPQDYFSYF